METYGVLRGGCISRKYENAELQTPEEVKELFNKYAGHGSLMTVPQLHRFMVEVQGKGTVTLAEAKKIADDIKSSTKHPHTSTTTNSICLDEFFTYLLSVDLNPPINPKVHQNMTAPLSHYFIYTGHNSYLTGNQISSDCSDVPIIQALQRGVRVIELDLWPTPNNEDVHVLHGKTLTTPVNLIKCLKSIKEYAFCASPYPVILTLEDHLNPTLQDKVAKLMVQIFGDMLFQPKSEILKVFPSPEELKHKVLISTKPPKEYLQDQTSINKGVKSAKEKSSAEEQKTTNEKIEQENSDEQDEDNRYDASLNENPANYKKLIAIPGIKRGKVKESLKVDPNKVSRLSWSEHLLANATATYGRDIVRYTQNNIMRIYPKFTRFTSSNYNPFLGWMHGAQMVAFNMQGHGKPLWLMQGLFRANGGCGYVLKPDFLMKLGPGNQAFDPTADLKIKRTLQVKIYLGDGWRDDFSQTHFDTYSPPDFYVKLRITSTPADKLKKETKKIKDQWIPSWNEEFSFPLRMPELALLSVRVVHYNMIDANEFAGQTCLPVSELRPGIHAVPLYDYKGEKYASVKLLMRFMFI